MNAVDTNVLIYALDADEPIQRNDHRGQHGTLS